MNGGRYVVVLEGSGCNVADVGGKAAGLDRLAYHGFPIPNSCAVTTEAYRQFVAASKLGDWLKTLSASPLPGPGDLEAAGSEVEARFMAGALLDEVRTAIEEVAAALLGEGPVAVRSSASAEDLGIASFAGQYRSFIGCANTREVLDAVRRCWASLWLPAVRAYRRHNDIPEDSLAMGVVVQSMIDADWSGVGFTIDPERKSTGLRIEVVPGMGEALVSGRITPDDFVVDRNTLEIVPAGRAEPPDFLEALARMLLQVEDRFDSPQDVEWATVNGEITLLQARPITVAGPTTAEDDGFDGPTGTMDTFTPRGVVEMLPDVVPPLLWTVDAPMVEAAFHGVVATLGGGDVAVGRRFLGRFRGRAALNLSALRSVAGALPGGSTVEVERQFLGRPLSDDDAAPAPTKRPGNIVGALRTRRAQRRLGDEVDLCAAAVSGIVQLDTDLGSLPVRRLLAYRMTLRDLAWRLTAAEVAASSAAAAAYRALELLLARWLSPTDAARWAQQLTAGSLSDVAVGLATTRRLNAAYADAASAHPGFRAALVAKPIERAPERIRQLGDAGRRFLSQVEWIVRSQGSRAVYGGATWAEDPTWAWEQLAVAVTYAEAEPRKVAPAPLMELTDLLGHTHHWRLWRVLTGQVVDLRLRWLRRQVDEASRFLAWRERAKGALLMLGGEERRIILEGSRRLLASRHLVHAGDVELLADGEFAAMLVGAPPPSDAEMFRRRAVLLRCRSAERLPETFDGAPGTQAPVAANADATLVGWAASPGIVEGRVKVVRQLAEGAKLEPGDVLVARATDPSWTPLLLVAGGLVLEEGGPLSHGAIVAREFGVPAVLNVPGAAATLDDGEVVQVDGFAGIVHRLERGEAA